MSTPGTSLRDGQRLRTRKDLLHAAGRLLKQGQQVTMDDVAREAMVSRATAYRYFPTLEALLVEAPLDGAVPDADELFAGDSSTDPVERVDRAEAALHAMTYQNEAQLRAMLAHALRQWLADAEHATPIRQNRRTRLIEAALAPVRERLDDDAYTRLCGALALVFGTESMLVFRDVFPLAEDEARRVKSWALGVLVRAALGESRRSERPAAPERGRAKGTAARGARSGAGPPVRKRARTVSTSRP
jgi:AcrR family transcriptional regulator